MRNWEQCAIPLQAVDFFAIVWVVQRNIWSGISSQSERGRTLLDLDAILADNFLAVW